MAARGGAYLVVRRAGLGARPHFERQLEDTLGQLKKDLTIVVVTSNLQQAARRSGYTGVVYLGRMVEIGPTGELFANPRVRQTDDYICGRFG